VVRVEDAPPVKGVNVIIGASPGQNRRQCVQVAQCFPNAVHGPGESIVRRPTRSRRRGLQQDCCQVKPSNTIFANNLTTLRNRGESGRAHIHKAGIQTQHCIRFRIDHHHPRTTRSTTSPTFFHNGSLCLQAPQRPLWQKRDAHSHGRSRRRW